jgi:hypothetical protein
MKLFMMVRQKFTEIEKFCSNFFLDESVIYSMNFQVVCEPREFINYDIQHNSDITFCLREFKVNHLIG